MRTAEWLAEHTEKGGVIMIPLQTTVGEHRIGLGRSMTMVMVVAALIALHAPSASAIVKCIAKIDPSSGVIKVSGRNVGVAPRWGVSASVVTSPFFDLATCQSGDRLSGCQIADPVTPAAKRPPAGCTIYVDDIGGDPVCAAFIKGCMPEGVDAGGNGVIRIDQARAQAGGVTPGDSPGFPVTISEAGSYQLTGNLDVQGEPNPVNATAIKITAESVTLDFNGFMIEGPVGCTTFGQLNCAPAGGSGRGVDAQRVSNVTVRNGTVEGMQAGLVLGDAARVEGMTVWFTAGPGIEAGAQSMLRGNTVYTSIPGVICKGACLVVNNTLRLNSDGVRTVGFAGGNTLIGNTVLGNQGTGLELANSDGYANNVITNNTSTVTGGVGMGGNVCNSLPICP
jgi:hypothetical protein